VISQNLVTDESSRNTGQVTFVVDTIDTLIAHPDVEIANRLADYSGHPAVVALRAGKKGQYEYHDANRQKWVAHLTVLSNGWGIITEQPSRLALSSLSTLRAMAWLVSTLATVLLVGLVYLVMRRSMAPISELASRATAIAGGDLYQKLPVQHMDEIGELSAAFNRLAEQLRGLVGSLDQRVEERTRAIELSSEVSSRLVTILDPDQLVRKVVEQLKTAFNYDHVQLYLFDERCEMLLLAGATGEAGRVLLARDHKVARGRGMVGRAANNNLPLLVENTTLDPSWLPNNLLPETRAEVAVPIAVGEQVLGVLDVQQNWVGGLGQLDVDLLQSLANQVAMTLQNARAFVSLQQQARREALVAAVNQKIQRTTTVEEALQVAVSELGQALAAKSARVELRSQQAPDRTSH
jgi:HAMP domain-containing protein